MTFKPESYSLETFVTELLVLNNPLTRHGIQEKSSSHVTYMD